MIQSDGMHANYPDEKARASSDIAPCRDFIIVGNVGKAQSRWNVGEIGKLMRKTERKVRKAAEVAALRHSLDKNGFPEPAPDAISENNVCGRKFMQKRLKRSSLQVQEWVIYLFFPPAA